jgi:hypothetical protein
MLFFFFGFAILDFWFPTHLKKKFIEQQMLLQSQMAKPAPVDPEPPKS